MMLLVGASLAHTCPDEFLQDTLPVDGAEAVPVDVQPAVLSLGCADAWDFELTAEGEPVVRDTVEEGLLLRMDLGLYELAADTLYTLTVSPSDDVDFFSSVTFTTSDAPLQGLSGEPEVAGAELIAEGAATKQLTGQVSVRPALDPDNLSVVLLLNGAGDVEQVMLPTEDTVRFDIDEEYDGDANYCIRAAQDDGAGLRHFAPVVCEPVDVRDRDAFMTDPDPRGCSTAPTGALGALGLLGLLLGLRRKG
jgi:MYXO-CTERM domain-containing protein